MNTKKSTGLKKKDTVQMLLSYEAKELDEKLQKFFAKARKNDSSDYKPDSLRVMLVSQYRAVI